jgi:hypothetical protein
MRNDRMSAIEQWDLPGPAALANEVALGLNDSGHRSIRLLGALHPIGEIKGNSTPQS